MFYLDSKTAKPIVPL